MFDPTKASTDDLVAEIQKLGGLIDKLREARKQYRLELDTRLNKGVVHPTPPPPPLPPPVGIQNSVTVPGQTLIAHTVR